MKPADYVALRMGVVGVAAVLFALLRGTRNRDAVGINLGRVNCPKCGEIVPLVRTPSSFRQAIWGGYTCRSCGQSMDKWGRARAG